MHKKNNRGIVGGMYYYYKNRWNTAYQHWIFKYTKERKKGRKKKLMFWLYQFHSSLDITFCQVNFVFLKTLLKIFGGGESTLTQVS